jgi:hypothetical protein
LNRKGELRFPRPAGQFHILMEEGPGQTIEFNERDVGQETGIGDQMLGIRNQKKSAARSAGNFENPDNAPRSSLS